MNLYDNYNICGIKSDQSGIFAGFSGVFPFVTAGTKEKCDYENGNHPAEHHQ